MTVFEIVLLILLSAAPALAIYLNKDSRKRYLCIIVLGVSILGPFFFKVIKSPESLYWTLVALEGVAIFLIIRPFRIPQWKNEGYLLVICSLMLLSVWNTLFYIYSDMFKIYAEMADTLAILTVLWMIGRSDAVCRICTQVASDIFGHLSDHQVA